MRSLPVVFAVVAVGWLPACSSGGTHNKPLARAAPTTTATSEPPSTAAPQSTCGPVPTSAKPGSGDVTPPGDIPDNQAFVAFASGDGRYSVKVPEGWGRTDQGAVTTFTDKLNTIRIELAPSAAAPSAASAAQELPALRAQSRCFEGGTVSIVQRRAGPAVLTTYRADGAADPVTGKVVHDDVERYEFWKAGNAAVITLSSPQGSDNVDPWRTVTDSFAWSS